MRGSSIMRPKYFFFCSLFPAKITGDCYVETRFLIRNGGSRKFAELENEKYPKTVGFNCSSNSSAAIRKFFCDKTSLKIAQPHAT
jgi:hypothetical protein